MSDSVLPRPSPKPIRNLRITFWGVQGSCPIFPTPANVREFARQVSLHTIGQILDRFGKGSSRAGEAGVRIEDLLGGPPTPANIDRLQQQIGLPEFPFYGGETTCVEVEDSDGNVIIIDAGSGLRRCSLSLVDRWANRADRTLHLFASHEHLDHRIGLTFARFCYVEPNPYKIHVYGNFQFLQALDRHFGVFSRGIGPITHMDDPVDYTMMPARFTAVELCHPSDPAPGGRQWPTRDLSQAIQIGKTKITAFEVYHVIPSCLAYKIEHNGTTFLFCTDHELRRGPDPDNPRQKRSLDAEARLRAMCQNVDLAYLDGQYFLDEYLGQKSIGGIPPFSRLDWGHGCIEDAIERSIACNIRHTLIGHHDPERSWTERIELDRHLARICEGKPNRVQLAHGDATIDL